MTSELPLPTVPSADDEQRAAATFTKVLVVDDHEVVRAGLISLIDREPDLSICGEAATELATLEYVRSTRPDVAVVDWSLGDRDASSLMTKLRVACPELPVLVLSMHDELYYAERAVRAGASGYVMKHEASGKVIAAIRTVAAGQRYFSERAERALARALTHGPGQLLLQAATEQGNTGTTFAESEAPGAVRKCVELERAGRRECASCDTSRDRRRRRR